MEYPVPRLDSYSLLRLLWCVLSLQGRGNCSSEALVRDELVSGLLIGNLLTVAEHLPLTILE